MKIKTFYARTMAEALLDIKASLGPDALILSTKPIARGSGFGGSASGFQVVAATDSKPAEGQDDGDCVKIASNAGNESAADSVTERMPEETARADNGGCSNERGVAVYSRARLERATADAAPAGHPDSRLGAGDPEIASVPRGSGPLSNAVARQFYQDLLANEVSSDLALSLVEQGCRRLRAEGRRPSRIGIVSAAADAAVQSLPAAQQTGSLPGKQILVFVGPAGVGKTTLIAKLAANLSLMNNKKVALVTLDTYRIGAVDQLRTYAGFMGLPFRVASDADDLRKAIGEHSRRDYILVDTPGRSLQQAEPISEMMNFLQATGRSEFHLVLSATTKSSDLHRMVDWYECSRPDFLVFTKLDETSTLGPVLNELVRTKKSVSYYSCGQRIPDDLHSVTREEIVDLVLNANPKGASTWIEPSSPALSIASTKKETKSRRARKATPKSSPSEQPRKRTARAQESLL